MQKLAQTEASEREVTCSEPLQSLNGDQVSQLPLYDVLFPLDDVLSKQMKCLFLGLVQRVPGKDEEGEASQL